MKQHEYSSKADAIQRTKDRRNLIWRMEEEENERELRLKSSVEIGAPDDKYEQEADAMAQKVTGVNPGNDSASKRQQEAPAMLMAKSETGGLYGTSGLESKLNSAAGSGQPLDDSIKNEMEHKMGADLSDVKVHTGSSAQEMSEGINAKAFTYGQDIYFNKGNYDTTSGQGKSLLAHELTHTQQQKGGVQRKIQRSLKMELQTINNVWKVDKYGNTSLLPRKYGPEGTSQERGDMPAYLSVGKKGERANKKGQFIKAEEESGMGAAKAGIDPKKHSQYVKIVKVRDLQKYIDEGVAPPESDISITTYNRAGEMNKSYFANSRGAYNKDTYEFKYYDMMAYAGHVADRKQPKWDNQKMQYDDGSLFSKTYGYAEEPPDRDVHRDQGGVFKPGRIKSMDKLSPDQEQYVQSPESVVNRDREAQYVVLYRVTDKNKNEIELISKTDNSTIAGKKDAYNPGTYEYKFYDAAATTFTDANQLPIHMDEKGKLQDGIVKFMEVQKKKPQYVQTYKVTVDPKGTTDYFGQKAKVELVEEIDNSATDVREGIINYKTWEKNYYLPGDFNGNALNKGAVPQNIHQAPDGSFESGSVTLMKKSNKDHEQTGIEVQSETDGVMEFETPKWYNRWSELRDRIQEAVSITDAISAQAGTNRELSDSDPKQKKVLDSMRRAAGRTLGQVMEWPSGYSTSHLKGISGGGRLLVEIVDSHYGKNWFAKIQVSQDLELSQFSSLLAEHDPNAYAGTLAKSGPLFDKAVEATVVENGGKMTDMNDVDKATKKLKDLEGMLQLIVYYIRKGANSNPDLEGAASKFRFKLMSRTSFHSMYKEILNKTEKKRFEELVKNTKAWSDQGIDTSQKFFAVRHGGTSADPAKRDKVTDPTIQQWLNSIITPVKDPYSSGREEARENRMTDLLSPVKAGSASMGAFDVEGKKHERDSKLVKFENRSSEKYTVNGTQGETQPAANWVEYARLNFKGAYDLRPRPYEEDDPTTLDKNEKDITGLIYDP